MLEVLNKNQVEEIEVKVTLRTINGEPDNEITKALAPFLPVEEESEEEAKFDREEIEGTSISDLNDLTKDFQN